MAMTTQELRAHLRTLPADQAEEVRVARKRVARRAYRDRHLRREASSGRLVSTELAGLQEDPEQLALFHERDAERKRRESGAARERVGVSSLVVFDRDDDALGRALDDERPEDAADAPTPECCKSGGRVSLRVLPPRVAASPE
jgi:hypothetical protein